MKKTVYIEADEEITSVISRIKKEKVRKITVVAPKGSIMLQSIVNLKMLKKHEKDYGKEIIIVTTDRTGLHLASEVGFEALRSLDKTSKESEEKKEEQEEKQKEAALAGFAVSDIGYSQKPEKQEEESESPNITFKTQNDRSEERGAQVTSKKIGDAPKKENAKEPKKKMSKTMKWLLVGFGSIAFISAFLGVIFVMPKAEIIITPLAEEVHEEVEVEIVLGEGNSIKGELLESNLEESKTSATTGTKNIGEKAKGSITVYNEWDSNPQPLVSGTRFVADGKTFKTTSAATVPGTTVSGGNIVAGTANVNVEASEAGETYNIGSSTFTIPGLPSEKQAKIYGKSTSAMSGGSTRTVKVVSTSDIDSLKTALTEEMKTKAKEDLEEKAGDKKILEAAVKEEISEENFSAKEGAETDELKLTYKINYWTVSFSEDDARGEIEKNIEKDLEENKEIVSGRLEDIEYKIVDENKEEGMILSVSATAFVVEKLELEQAKYDIPGKNKEDTINYFKEKEQIVDVSVDFWPFWVKKVPLNRSRIFIEVNVSSNE